MIPQSRTKTSELSSSRRTNVEIKMIGNMDTDTKNDGSWRGASFRNSKLKALKSSTMTHGNGNALHYPTKTKSSTTSTSGRLYKKLSKEDPYTNKLSRRTQSCTYRRRKRKNLHRLHMMGGRIRTGAKLVSMCCISASVSYSYRNGYRYSSYEQIGTRLRNGISTIPIISMMKNYVRNINVEVATSVGLAVVAFATVGLGVGSIRKFMARKRTSGTEFQSPSQLPSVASVPIKPSITTSNTNANANAITNTMQGASTPSPKARNTHTHAKTNAHNDIHAHSNKFKETSEEAYDVWKDEDRIQKALAKAKRSNDWVDQSMSHIEEKTKRIADEKAREEAKLDAMRKEQAKEWVQATMSRQMRELEDAKRIRLKEKREKDWAESILKKDSSD